MKKSLLAVLAVSLSLGVVHSQAAVAATAKKKSEKTVAKQVQAKSSNASRVRISYTNGVPTRAQAPHAIPVRHVAMRDDEVLGPDSLRSAAFLVQDQATGSILMEKNSDAVVPIASISKLMTAMVVLDANPNLRELITISEEDKDNLKGTGSRLSFDTTLPREEMLRLSLMASENRATSALSRYYPGGRPAFVAAMNRKAQQLGLAETHFQDPTGLNSGNVSSARDLVKMVAAAHRYPLIREFTTTASYTVQVAMHKETRRRAGNGKSDVMVKPPVTGYKTETFNNTNALVRNGEPGWDIGLSKTGFINEAGKCLVMQAWFNQKPLIIVLLDSFGKFTRIEDANRVKRWVEHTAAAPKLSAS